MKWALVAATAAVAVAAPVALWAWPREAPLELRGSTPPAGLTLPSFALPDQNGRTIESDDLRGKVVLVTFLETQCTESCPIIGEMIREAFRRLDGEAVALGISVHPGDDTPAAVREYLRRHRLRGELHYLVAAERELRPVWKAFAVLPAVDTHDPNIHSAPVRVYDADGEWVSTLHAGADLTPDNLVNDVRAASAG
jgi:protein SCO1/2